MALPCRQALRERQTPVRSDARLVTCRRAVVPPACGRWATGYSSTHRSAAQYRTYRFTSPI